MSYTIQINAGTPATLAALGVVGARLALRANGIDSLDIDIAAAIDAAATFAPAATIILRDGDTIRFIGIIHDDPRDDDVASGPIHRYRIHSPVYQLTRLAFSQLHYAYVRDGDTNDLVSVSDPRVVLGRTSPIGPRITTAGQIAAILDFAAAGPAVPIARDTSTWPAGISVPVDERTNISCWEAIITQLRWQPDHVLWCDYSSGTCTVKLTPAASLTPVTLAATGGILDTVRLIPRHDLVASGARCTFRRIDAIDGGQKETRIVQVAGNWGTPGAIDIHIDLEGGSSGTTIEQTVTVGSIPTAANKSWIKSRVGWLLAIPDNDLIVHAVTYNSALPRELLTGSISSWMGVTQEPATITVDLTYTTRDADGDPVDSARITIPIQITATNATSKTYRNTTGTQAPEPVPIGLADALYAAWSILHYDGRFVSDLTTVTWAPVPGSSIRLTGGPAAWATMAATVQDATIDLASGAIHITVGTCRRTEADNLTALYRAVRGRRPQTIGSDDQANSSPSNPGAIAFPANQITESPAFARSYLALKGGAPQNAIVLDPAAAVFADDTHDTSHTLTLREAVVPTIVAGAVVAKLAQIVCSDPYGDPIPIGAADNSFPTNPKHLGGSSSSPLAEGADDAALTDTYSPNETSGDPETPNQDGLSIWVLCRERYAAAGSFTWYAYWRKLTWPSALAPRVSAEVRAAIDEPDEWPKPPEAS